LSGADKNASLGIKHGVQRFFDRVANDLGEMVVDDLVIDPNEFFRIPLLYPVS